MEPGCSLLPPAFNKVFFKGNTYPGEWINDQVSRVSDYIGHLETTSPFILLFAHNHINTIIAYYAILQSGHSCVLLEPEIGPIELKEIREDTRSSLEIRFSADASDFDCERDMIFNPGSRKWRPEFPDISQPSTVVYTNAESGYAKGAVLSCDNLYANAYSYSVANMSTSKSTICSLPPFHHLYGLTTGMICPSISNCSLLVAHLSDFRKINLLADQIADSCVTHLYSVPIILHWLLRTDSIKKIIDNVQFLSSGGYKLPEYLFDQYKSLYNVEIREGYGLTEASPICTWQQPGEAVIPQSVGKPISCCNIKITGNDGNTVPIRTVGEVCISGPHVMTGYLNNRKATEEVIIDGWLMTGDLGYLDENGYLFLTGLKKKMANVAGKSIYPAELFRLIRDNTRLGKFELEIMPTSNQGDKIILNVPKEFHENYSGLIREVSQILSASKIPKFNFNNQ